MYMSTSKKIDGDGIRINHARVEGQDWYAAIDLDFNTRLYLSRDELDRLRSEITLMIGSE